MGDTLDEFDETFVVNLSSPTNATIADSQGVGTIVDNDAAPALAINNVTVTEVRRRDRDRHVHRDAVGGERQDRHGGLRDERRAPPPRRPTTRRRPARSRSPRDDDPDDPVDVQGDLLDEANETYRVTLSNPGNATITTAIGTGTITDNDPLPVDRHQRRVADAKGNAGTSNANFTVTLSAPSGRNVTVNYATANSTAVQPGDYTTTSGTLTFTPGQVTKTVSVPVVGDVLDEIDETFFVNLSGPTNATIADTPRASARSWTTTRRRRSRSTTSRSPRATPGPRT